LILLTFPDEARATLKEELGDRDFASGGVKEAAHGELRACSAGAHPLDGQLRRRISYND
jgi:hypothetical protein